MCLFICGSLADSTTNWYNIPEAGDRFLRRRRVESLFKMKSCKHVPRQIIDAASVRTIFPFANSQHPTLCTFLLQIKFYATRVLTLFIKFASRNADFHLKA